ncbi:MAG: MFS transporter [bacterium]
MKKELFFSAAKFPFFYGWVVLGVSTLGMIMSIPGQTIGISVFTEDLKSVLNISSLTITISYLIGTCGSGLLITYAGKLFDRHGARKVAAFASIFLGLFLAYLSYTDKISFYLVNQFNFINRNVILITILSIGFFGIRFFGQGVLTMSSRNMAMKWFEKNRGFANTFLSIFTIVAFNYSPTLLNDLVNSHGWRGTWQLLAWVITILFTIIIIVSYKDNPYDVGCKPDGNKPLFQKKKKRNLGNGKDHTLKQAISSFSFWPFNLLMTINAFLITGFTFHVEDIFLTAGFSSGSAFSIFVPSAVISFFASLIFSNLSDFVKLKYLLVLYGISLALVSSSIIFLGFYQYATWLFILGNGMMGALYFVLSAVTWPRFFGIQHLGAISGYSLSWVVIASALGPILFALSKFLFKSYIPIGLFISIISIILIFLSVKTNNPNENELFKNRL